MGALVGLDPSLFAPIPGFAPTAPAALPTALPPLLQVPPAGLVQDPGLFGQSAAVGIDPALYGQPVIAHHGPDPSLYGQAAPGSLVLDASLYGRPAPPAPAVPAPAVPTPGVPASAGQAAVPATDPALYGQATTGAQRSQASGKNQGSGTRFSGAPLWRFSLRRDEQRRLQEEENQRQGVPEGFARHSDGFFYHPQKRMMWKNSKFYLYNDLTKAYTEIHEAGSGDKELRLCIDASCFHKQDGVKEHRSVIIRDLVKAGQALKMPIDHLPRPCTLLAIYEGHRPVSPSSSSSKPVQASEESPPVCAEFCARNLHLKLLTRLSAFQGNWDDAQIIAALRRSCADLDAEFLERESSKTATDGCCAVVALFAGQRQFVAGVGRAIGLLGSEGADGRQMVSRQTVEHSLADNAEYRRVCSAGGHVVQDGQHGQFALRAKTNSAEVLHTSRAFGDRAFKADTPGAPSIVIATPDVTTTALQQRHHFLALVCGEAAGVLSDESIADVLRRRSGRPRMACGALLQEAQTRGASGSLSALCVFFDWRSKGEKAEEATSSNAPPPGKKPRLDVASSKQVRCRHILVKHKDCKEPVDRVRGSKPVTRSLAEAERILREALEAIENSPEKSIFTQRCKAVSECNTCLKGGEMAGDLGWMTLSKGQAHASVESAAFLLPVGHISDIVESDEGVHVLWRIA